MKHIILITLDGENTWKPFDTETKALEYADELHEQFEAIETIYITI